MFEFGLRHHSHCNIGGFFIVILTVSTYTILPSIAGGLGLSFNDDNGQQGTYMTYDKYRSRFVKAMNRLKLTYRPHETRHTVITKAKECHVDEYILKLITGHAITDIIEKAYTHRTMGQLHKEICKITK